MNKKLKVINLSSAQYNNKVMEELSKKDKKALRELIDIGKRESSIEA